MRISDWSSDVCSSDLQVAVVPNPRPGWGWLKGASARVPMAKAKVQFLCNHCGSVHPKWMGKCPDCGTWDSLQEYKTPKPDAQIGRAACRERVGQYASIEVVVQSLKKKTASNKL